MSETNAPNDLRLNERVGSWQLVALIDEGGMSQVYEARHVVVGRRAAVKFMDARLIGKSDFCSRFLQEAKIAGKLENRHITPVWDSGLAADGTPYLVMELLEGQSLASIISEQEFLEPDRAANLVLQACRGIQVAHQSGVIHRDLKPGNLFVCPQEDGTELLKILDFGIAKLESGTVGDLRTNSAIAIGTPHYMSPEHARGAKDVDKRTDIYALGVILFEALCGKRPYDGDSFNAILYHIATGPEARLDLVNPNLPRALVDVVHHAMARERSARFPSAEELADALYPFQYGCSTLFSPRAVLRSALPAASSEVPTPVDELDTLPMLPQRVPHSGSDKPVVVSTRSGLLQEFLGLRSKAALLIGVVGLAATVVAYGALRGSLRGNPSASAMLRLVPSARGSPEVVAPASITPQWTSGDERSNELSVGTFADVLLDGHGGSETASRNGQSSITSLRFAFPAKSRAWQPSAQCLDTAKRLVATMSVSEKSGQMVMVNVCNVANQWQSPDVVLDYHPGAIMISGECTPPDGSGIDTWVARISEFLVQGQRRGTPLLCAMDAVHGNNKVKGAVIFPHNIGLGMTRDPKLVEQIGRITALETRAIGVNWTLAPLVGPALDERWGRTYETFAETPELAAELGAASLRGLQGPSLASKTSILACAKHFAGDGTTDHGISMGDSSLSDDDFMSIALKPYELAVDAGAATIMVSRSSHRGIKMSSNRQLLTEALKGTMGFKGFLLSNWRAAQQIESESPEPDVPDAAVAPTRSALATVINAGLDMIMEPFGFAKVTRYIEEATSLSRPENERISIERIDDAVTRILSVKCEMGMFAPDYISSADAQITQSMGSAQRRALARDAVSKTVVLLKNNNHVVPIDKKSARLLVLGTAADDIARQCGGYTFDWQGPKDSDLPKTTILQGLKDAVAHPANVTYGVSDLLATRFTHAIVVIGERPYAEASGDVLSRPTSRNPLTLSLCAEDVSAIDTAKRLGLPTIVVIISGRPLLITDHLTKADAWLAAWLPGTEGGGVADVLFGKHHPTATLSHSWPRSYAQIPINHGDPDYGRDPPLFPYGYGLTY